MKNFFIPQCSKPTLLVNQNALRLIYDGAGTMYDGRMQYFGSFINDMPLGSFVKHGYEVFERDGVDALASYVTTLDDVEEYFFQLVPCGKCIVCKDKYRNDLVFRAMMESQLYDCPPYFITLTYDNEHLPDNGQLRYTDIQKFYKRLRRSWDYRKIKHAVKFICAGEYGSRYGRPHYHLLLFNNPYKADQMKYDLDLQLKDDVFNAWGKCQRKAFECDECIGGAASYATKYLTKQHQSAKHYIKPFVKCSKGIGAAFIDGYSEFMRNNPSAQVLEFTDKNGVFQSINLGRYAQRHIYPSPSECVPLSHKLAYRELINIIPLSVACGLLTPDYAIYLAEQLRPAYIRNKLTLKNLPLYSCSRCFLKNTYLRSILSPTLDDLISTLAIVYNHDGVYLEQLEKHRELMPPQVDNSKSLAQKYAQKFATISNQLAKEYL